MGPPGSSGSLAEWLSWLETLSPSEINLGLSRVVAVLERMRLRRPARVITVAGTNGKGSSVAMLEALYLQESTSVGCYSSPHIHRYNERIKVGGVEVDDRTIVDAFGRVELCRQGAELTYFEYGTLAAFSVFDQAETATIILEVGMGGRLDAVNALDADGGIITNISLDHCAWLGSDVEAIANEKAGILRKGKPFVYADPVRPRNIDRVATAVGADLRACGRDYHFETASERWSFHGNACVLTNLARPALTGTFQVQNAAGVLALVEALGDTHLLDANTVQKAFSTLVLNGRFQVFKRQQRWIIDVAHNPAGASTLAKALADELAQRGARGEVTCIIGLLNDKDVSGVVASLAGEVDHWIALTAAGPRAIVAHELARLIANASGKPCLIGESVADACAIAEREARSGDTVLVTGSFMTVGPVLRWLEEQGTEGGTTG